METMASTEPRKDKGRRNSREATNPVCGLPEISRCNEDFDNVLGLMGIIGTFLNLLVVVLVYIFTPI